MSPPSSPNRSRAQGKDQDLSVRRVREVARDVFGHTSLLPGQEEAMGALLDGHDVLLVAPTGAGKSLAYQVPAVLLDGPTVVISPLLALQRDQLESLTDADERTQGVRLSSAETPKQQEEALAAVASGESEFVFLSPEQLAREEVQERLAELRPSLVAVDEAHCVSAWGHDFRPDYFRLGELIATLGSPRVIALTATAAPPVRQDIVDRIRLKDPRTLVTGFARPNLALIVRRCVDEGEQRDQVLDAVRDTPGPGIVYCRTRKATEQLAGALTDSGVEAVVYHAGLSKKRRDEAHDRFMSGDLDVVVATSAFGMGIDKPDIRFVFHAQAPESLDTYYQEVGRAGRDGEPASAVLFYRPEDLALGRFFSGAPPKKADVRKVLDAAGTTAEVDRDEVRRATGLGPRKVGRILNLLDEVTAGDAPRSKNALVEAVVAQGESHRALENSRVEMMRGYAETDRCRWQFILGYFGEESGEPCGHCDRCEEGTAESTPQGSGRFALQSRVTHPEFGDGTVMDVENDKITVLFESAGYRTLALGIVEDEDLLTDAG
jgi:ATP-dependent DNA helicase RecQ